MRSLCTVVVTAVCGISCSFSNLAADNESAAAKGPSEESSPQFIGSECYPFRARVFRNETLAG